MTEEFDDAPKPSVFDLKLFCIVLKGDLAWAQFEANQIDKESWGTFEGEEEIFVDLRDIFKKRFKLARFADGFFDHFTNGPDGGAGGEDLIAFELRVQRAATSELASLTDADGENLLPLWSLVAAAHNFIKGKIDSETAEALGIPFAVGAPGGEAKGVPPSHPVLGPRCCDLSKRPRWCDLSTRLRALILGPRTPRHRLGPRPPRPGEHI